MSDERILGALVEFKETTMRRLNTIETKVDSLSSFRWKAVGALGIVFVLGEMVNLYRAFAGK